MTKEQDAAIEKLQAQRYTVQNKLSSVNTRLKGTHSAEKTKTYEERQRALLAERDRLGAEIKALKSK